MEDDADFTWWPFFTTVSILGFLLLWGRITVLSKENTQLKIWSEAAVKRKEYEMMPRHHRELMRSRVAEELKEEDHLRREIEDDLQKELDADLPIWGSLKRRLKFSAIGRLWHGYNDSSERTILSGDSPISLRIRKLRTILAEFDDVEVIERMKERHRELEISELSS